MNIMLAKPGIIKRAAKKRLREENILLIETESFLDIKLISTDYDETHSELLNLAINAMNESYSSDALKIFRKYVTEAVIKSNQ